MVVGGIEDSSYRMHRAAAPDATLHDVASDGVIVNVLSRRDQSMQLVVARHREGPNGSDDRAIRVTEIVGELALCSWLDSRVLTAFFQLAMARLQPHDLNAQRTHDVVVNSADSRQRSCEPRQQKARLTPAVSCTDRPTRGCFHGFVQDGARDGND